MNNQRPNGPWSNATPSFQEEKFGGPMVLCQAYTQFTRKSNGNHMVRGQLYLLVFMKNYWRPNGPVSIGGQMVRGQTFPPVMFQKISGSSVCDQTYLIIGKLKKSTFSRSAANHATLEKLKIGGQLVLGQSIQHVEMVQRSVGRQSNLLEPILPYDKVAVQHYQAGFCSGKSTTDQLIALRQILEKGNEYNMPTHYLFIDFNAALTPSKKRGLR
jgi:hypothetical protein